MECLKKHNSDPTRDSDMQHSKIEITKTLGKTLKTLPPADQLGFGKYFSDHFFISHFSAQNGWYNSEIKPYEPLQIHPGASVLHYGQALFEGMKAFKQKSGQIALFRPEFNYARFKEGAERLCLDAPPLELFMEGIKQLVTVEKNWVPDGANCSLYIRPTLIGTEAFLGVRPSQEALFFVLLSPCGNYFAEGSKPVKIWVEETYVRAAPGGLGATKAAANYASSMKAAQTAKAKGYSQVLWLDTEHSGIEEVGTMNVFFVFKDEVVTPALNGSILAGGMRNCVIELLKHKKKNIVERRITIAEVIDRLKRGDLLEAFGTGTAAVISPIGTLHYQNQDWAIHKNENGPLSVELHKDISEIQRGQAKDAFNWLQILA